MKVLVKGNLILPEKSNLQLYAVNGAEITYGVGNMPGDFDMVIEGDMKVDGLSVFFGDLYVGGNIIYNG